MLVVGFVVAQGWRFDIRAFPCLRIETSDPQIKTCLWGPRHGAPIFVPDRGRLKCRFFGLDFTDDDRLRSRGVVAGFFYRFDSLSTDQPERLLEQKGQP